MNIGALYQPDQSCEFTVWAPQKKQIEVRLCGANDQRIPLKQIPNGYWHARVLDLPPDATYAYIIDGECERPDPASFNQPNGVHKPSGIVDHHAHAWNDAAWKGIPLNEMIMYELHVGTFTDQGTFAGIMDKLDYLTDLGINTIEIMPVSQFPGSRNWGYDGVHPFSVQNTYGGPHGLKKLVDLCHQKGLAVILDVVYNHLGPEGNYLSNFGPYFTDKYQTPWGWAINFDDAHSPGVRNYFIQNALYWFDYFHIDALRLDAIHGIYDFGAKHILKEMSEAVDAFNAQNGRAHYLIAESDLNDRRVIEPKEQEGYGMDAQWLDDFHHAFRTLVTNDRKGYYKDFGRLDQMAKAYQDGFVYDWIYSLHRKKNFGSSSSHLEADKFVVFAQNHDQVGNRMNGERLTLLTDFESLKLAAGCVLLSPHIPMLFMGEEFGADTPFLYFISHLDADLVKAVQNGRKAEFAAFDWQGEPPDPQAEDTFNRSRLNWGSLKETDKHTLFSFYQYLIRLRKQVKALNTLTKKGLSVRPDLASGILVVSREAGADTQTKDDQSRTVVVFNFQQKKTQTRMESASEPLYPVVNSADVQWGGPGAGSDDFIADPAANIAGQPVTLMPRSFILCADKPGNTITKE
jgi:maltooligosyltrehalose trehalohydrolase